jgi:hypothetical protein
LERLAMRVPGYQGYHARAHRRTADVALRSAITLRLDEAHERIDNAAARCREKEAMTEAAALERIGEHIRRVSQRVRAASSGVEPFYGAHDFRHSKADALHAVDHAMLEVVDEFLDLCIHQAPGHDWAAHLQSELDAMERKLDERAHIHRIAGS